MRVLLPGGEDRGGAVAQRQPADGGRRRLEARPGVAAERVGVAAGQGHPGEVHARRDGGLPAGRVVHAVVQQHVQQVLTAVILVAAGQGVAFVPASAAALGVEGVVFKALTDLGGGHPDSEPARPVELHAIWSRGA